MTPAELRKALRSLRASHDADRADHRAELAKFLAERFNLDQSKVEDALPELGRGPDGGPGRGGPGHHGPGFGGPGFGGPPPGP